MKPGKTYLSLNVIVHPADSEGGRLASEITRHFSQTQFAGWGEELGISVFSTSVLDRPEGVPEALDWEETEIVLPIIMIGSDLVGSENWTAYVRKVFQESKVRNSHVLPVMIDAGAYELQLDQKALQYDRWTRATESPTQRLLIELSHGISQFLTYRLAARTRQHEGAEELGSQTREKVQVFISYAHNCQDGSRIADTLRRWMAENSSVGSFMDLYDIPAGMQFNDVIQAELKRSATLSVHSDLYSTRPWCRYEVIHTKLYSRPLVVASCLRINDARSIPYLANAPIVRVCPDQPSEFGSLVQVVLDEVLRDFLWHNRVTDFGPQDEKIVFMARSPELISLATIEGYTPANELIIVYPEPALSVTEIGIFQQLAPKVRLLTLTQWREEQQ